MAGLRDAVRQADVDRANLERRVAEERGRTDGAREALERRLEDDRAREDALRALIAGGDADEVKALKAELGATRDRIATLETERAVGERIIRAYGNGVCLIQGSYGFSDAAGRPLRYAGATEDGEPDGTPAADGKGAPYTVDYYGTGLSRRAERPRPHQPPRRRAVVERRRRPGLPGAGIPAAVRPPARVLPTPGRGVRDDRGTGVGGRRPRADAGGDRRTGASRCCPSRRSAPAPSPDSRSSWSATPPASKRSWPRRSRGWSRRSSSPTARTPTA